MPRVQASNIRGFCEPNYLGLFEVYVKYVSMSFKFKKLAFEQNRFQLIWTSFAHPNQSLNPNCLNCRLRQNEFDFVYCIPQIYFGFKFEIFAYLRSPRCYVPGSIDNFKLSQVEVEEPGHFLQTVQVGTWFRPV